MDNIKEETLEEVAKKELLKNPTFIFYTVKDIQHIFGINKDRAYQLVATKDFPKMRIGNSIRVNAAELQKYIEKKCITNVNL